MNSLVDGARIAAAGSAPQLPCGVTGVFESLLLRIREPIFWPQHWSRFAQGCRRFGLKPPFQSAELLTAVEELARANAVSTGIVRYAAWFRGDGALSWRVDVMPPRPHMRLAEFQVARGATALPAVDADRRYKHLGRGPWLAALAEARARGFAEVLLCDARGVLVEGAVSNVFFVRDGALHTPALDVGPLAGVMRAEVLDFARARDWRVIESRPDRAALDEATEIWLTNSLIGIRPLSQLGSRVLPSDRPWLTRFRAEWSSVWGWDPVVVCGPGSAPPPA